MKNEIVFKKCFPKNDHQKIVFMKIFRKKVQKMSIYSIYIYRRSKNREMIEKNRMMFGKNLACKIISRKDFGYKLRSLLEKRVPTTITCMTRKLGIPRMAKTEDSKRF